MSTFGDRPAFPRPGYDLNEDGMSLRAFITAHVLAGPWAANDTTTWESEPEAIAQRAVAIADATLKELEKEGR